MQLKILLDLYSNYFHLYPHCKFYLPIQKEYSGYCLYYHTQYLKALTYAAYVA